MNKIRLMIKEANKKVGMGCAEHALRHVSIGTIVNDEHVNGKEALAFSRHSSLAANRNYAKHGSKSESARFNALGLSRFPPKRPFFFSYDTCASYFGRFC